MTIADGFPGERMLVLPEPEVLAALDRPGTAHLTVTDCGYFPEARSHGRTRSHPLDEAVVLVCSAGAGWCRTRAGRFPVAAGQVVIVPPGEAHSYGADDSEPWTLWWMHVRGHQLSEVLEAASMTADAPVRTLTDVFHAVGLMAEVLRWRERDATPQSLTAASGAAWHLLTTLAAERTVDDTRGAALDRAADFLREHPEEHIEVAELAAMVRLSPSHFAALFRQRFDTSVLQFQTQLRMTRARELLDTTDRTIPEVAEAVGYGDSFYFARLFKRVHGLTPTGYRRRRE